MINYVHIANMWFMKTSDILWKEKVQDILRSIKICTIVQENISKADQAIMLHDVRLYSVLTDMK